MTKKHATKSKALRKSAGLLIVGDQKFRLVLEPDTIVDIPKGKSHKNPAPATIQTPFPTTFQLMITELNKVKAAAKPELNRLGKKKSRFKVGKTTFEGSFTHFIEVAALVLLEGRGPLNQLDLHEAVTSLLQSSGFMDGKRKIKFEMRQLKASMDRLVRDKHVTEAGITYTFRHYPHYRTLSVVVG